MAGQLDGMQIAVLLEQGVNEVEYQYCRLRAREAGAKVIVVGNSRHDYLGESRSEITADVTIDDVQAAEFDGVLIPGGLAPEKLRLNTKVVEFVRNLFNSGKLCAAICHGQQVLISAGLLKARHAVAAWSMVDDLKAIGAIHDPDIRAVRDENIVTARFPTDLPEFFARIFEGIAELSGRPVPAGYGNVLKDKTVGILVDTATSDVQTFYPSLRMQEEGAEVVLLGRTAGAEVQLGNPTWEWGGAQQMTVERALSDVGAVDSHDMPFEASLKAIKESDLDGMVIPGGLGTWLVRGHPGLKSLIRDMHAAGKPIGAIGRGPKVLLSAGILEGTSVACAPEMRDDLIFAGISYRELPTVRDGNILTCRGTEDMPDWAPQWIDMI